MQISYFSYELKPSSSSANALSQQDVRQGALLKIEWPDGRMGFADLHPWPERGDQNLEEQLSALRKGKMTVLIEQSLWLAQRDAAARKQKKSLFDGGPLLRNNFLIGDATKITTEKLDDIRNQGFQTLKIKVGRDLEEEVKLINRLGKTGQFNMRLDFNSIATWPVFERFMSSLDKRTMSFIEYVEDPFPFDAEAWKEAQSFSKIAVDFELASYKWSETEAPPFNVVVLKPARQDVEKIMKWATRWNLRVTVTSSLDHPVGNLHAYSVAQELSQNYSQIMNDPGCLSFDTYQMNKYAAAIQVKGPYIVKNPFTGIGFDLLLMQEPWNSVKIR